MELLAEDGEKLVLPGGRTRHPAEVEVNDLAPLTTAKIGVARLVAKGKARTTGHMGPCDPAARIERLWTTGQIVPGDHILVVAPAPGMEAGAAVVDTTAAPPPSRRNTTRTASGSETGTEGSE